MKKTTTPARTSFINPIPEVLSSTVITSQHTDKIFAALSKAQGEVEKARRSKKGVDEQTHTSWEYAALDDVLDAVKEARADHGLAVVERFPAGKAALHAVLVHESGQWIDYGTYAFGDYKTQNEKSEIITRARRHFLKCMFGVVDQVEDRDESAANTRPIKGEGMEEPLADDTGGRQLTDKERREAYQEAKNAWSIDPVVTVDGRIDFDQFAADYEKSLGLVRGMNDLAMLGKANNAVLNDMQAERPELFASLQDIISPFAQKFI